MYFFSCNSNLFIFINGLSEAKQRILGANPYSTFDNSLPILQHSPISQKQFLRTLKQFFDHGGYCQECKFLFLCDFPLSSAAFYIKNIDIVFVKPPKLSHLLDFLKTSSTQFLASVVLYLLHVKFVK